LSIKFLNLKISQTPKVAKFLKIKLQTDYRDDIVKKQQQINQKQIQPTVLKLFQIIKVLPSIIFYFLYIYKVNVFK